MAYNPEVTGSKPVIGNYVFFLHFIKKNTYLTPLPFFLSIHFYPLILLIPSPYLFARLHVIHHPFIRLQVCHSFILELFHFHLLLLPPRLSRLATATADFARPA